MAKPVITTPLEITPIKDIYYVADNLNAKFTIKNIGDAPITFDKLLVGGRFNGGKLPNGEFPDFTFRSTTLQPNVPYQYAGTFTLIHSGNYHFFIAYYIENPTPEEKKLLDENNWNTCVDLGEGLTHTNRIKNTIVLEKELPPPGTVSESRDRINHNLQQQVKYPPYLPDSNSFPSAVATTWAKFTSWVTQTHLTERYDEFYQTGIDYDCLSFKALKNARDSLDRGDTVSAEKYLQKSYTYKKLSAMSFGAAEEVFDGNLEAGEILAEGIKDGCEASVKFGLAITNPEAAKVADYLYIGVDYAVDRALVGEKPAAKKAIVKAGVTIIFNKIKFEDLGDKTIADYTENKIGKVTFPMLQKAFKNNEQIQFLASKIIKESGVKIGEKVAEDIATYSWNELEKAVNFEEIEVKSPVELRVYDSQGEVTGLINGEVEHGISRSVYDNGTATILFPLDSYRYEVVGTDEGTYGLTVTSVEDGNVTTFTAIDIPTAKGVRHQYAIDWNAISQGKNGTTLMIDSDGDGIFEKTVTADNKLSQENYFALMPKTIYVPDDYAKIQYAVDNASAGDTIIVKSGTYYENVNVTKRLRLQGVDTGMGKPVVDAGGYGSPITLSVDRITLEGFKLINSGSSWVWDVGGDAGINVISNSNTIIGNIATNNYLDGIFLFRSRGNIVKGNIASNNGGGIILWRSSGNIIKDNTVRNNNCGIYLHLFSTNNTIIGNTASNNIYDGIALWLYSSSNNITGNTASKNGYEGISIYDSRGNIITGNTASNNNEYGICLYNSSGNTITGNTASNNMYDGIHLTASSNNTITGNTLNSNKYQGFLLGNSNGNTITKNTISNNREYGIQLINSKNNKIYLNNFINIGYTPRSSESSNIWNSIEPMTYRYKGSTFTNYPGNYWSDYTGSDADGDGIGVIPYVIDSDKDNYPLMETFENYISAP